MKVISILALSLSLYSYCFSQILTVKDAETSMPLEQASVTSKTSNLSVITDSKGQADISAFRGKTGIEVNHIGYEIITVSFEDLEQADFVLFMAGSAFNLDEVVFSVTKWKHSKRETPSKVVIISVKEVALRQPQTAADLLETSGEVFIQKSQMGGGSPMIRGFSTNRLLYAIDGVRMNTAIFRSGNLQNVISLDPFAIEKTEILFGPGSVIYGSDAIGGVMSFQTITPLFSAGDEPIISGKIIGRYSTANQEKTGHFDINIGWNKWASVTSFSTFDFDDLKMGSYGPEEYLRPFYVQRIDNTDVVIASEDPKVQRPTGYSQTNLMQKLRFQPNENWDFHYGFHYSTTSDYSRYDRHIRLRNGLPRSAEWKYGPQTWMMNHFTATHSGNNFLYDEAALRLANQLFEESRIDRDMNDPDRRTRVEKVNAWSVNVDFTKSLNTSNKLYYGLEYVFDDVESTGKDENIITGEAMAGPARYPQSTWASYAAYLTWQHDFSENLLLQTGARYNHFTLDATFDTTFYPFPFSTANINNGALTGSIGTVYHPAPDWTLGASLATAFRSPNVDDVGKVFDSEPGSVVVPNPDLNAEYAYNAELHIARILGNNVKVDLTGYYTILQNALVRRDFTLNGHDSIVYDGELSKVQAIQNAAKATVYGLQAGLEVKLPGGFGFISHFNYQKGEEELDDGSTSPLRHAAPWFGSSHLTFTTTKLTLDFYAVYNGEKSFEDLPEEEKGKGYIYATDENDNPYSPSWYTLNFKALFDLNSNISIGAGVENLTDRRYRPYSSGIVAPGRNVVLSVRVGF